MEETCERISERLGKAVSKGTLSNIEAGRRPASNQFLIAYAEALGFDHLDIWKPAVVTSVEDTESTVARAS